MTAPALLWALTAGSWNAVADALCRACSEVARVDAAVASLVSEGVASGRFALSAADADQLEEASFTLGKGPPIDAVVTGRRTLVGDLTIDGRWPGYRQAVLDLGMSAVFAFPVTLADRPLAALTLFRCRAGPLDGDHLDAALQTASLLQRPLRDLALRAGAQAGLAGDEESSGLVGLAGLARMDIAQATGLLMHRLAVDAPHAQARLRALAFARGSTTSAAARAVLSGELTVEI